MYTLVAAEKRRNKWVTVSIVRRNIKKKSKVNFITSLPHFVTLYKSTVTHIQGHQVFSFHPSIILTSSMEWMLLSQK